MSAHDTLAATPIVSPSRSLDAIFRPSSVALVGALRPGGDAGWAPPGVRPLHP